MSNIIDVNNPESIKEYLDSAIIKWREKLEEENFKYSQALLKVQEDDILQEILIATCYIDAFQSARVSLFGELLPK